MLYFKFPGIEQMISPSGARPSKWNGAPHVGEYVVVLQGDLRGFYRVRDVERASHQSHDSTRLNCRRSIVVLETVDVDERIGKAIKHVAIQGVHQLFCVVSFNGGDPEILPVCAELDSRWNTLPHVGETLVLEGIGKRLRVCDGIHIFNQSSMSIRPMTAAYVVEDAKKPKSARVVEVKNDENEQLKKAVETSERVSKKAKELTEKVKSEKAEKKAA